MPLKRAEMCSKIIRGIMNSNTVLCRLLIFSNLILCLSLNTPLALGGSPSTTSSSDLPKMPTYAPPLTSRYGNEFNNSPLNFKKYIINQYKNVSHAESDVKQTSYGPSGRIFIVGDIAPQKRPDFAPSTEPDPKVRARAVARAFMEDEQTLLGIGKPDEINEVDLVIGKGKEGDVVNIYYKRFVNGIELDDANLLIVVGPNDTISEVHAWLVPVPPETYDSTQKPTLTEYDIQAIVDAQLSDTDRSGLDMNSINKSFKKIAITNEPYVIWKVSYIYQFTIDAFTGKILKKESGILSPFKAQQPRVIDMPPRPSR